MVEPEIEMRGRWETHEPMIGEDFQPLVGQAYVEPDNPLPVRTGVADRKPPEE